MENRNEGGKSWTVRRRFMFVVSAFCMIVIWYVLYRDLQSAPAEAAVTMGFITLGGIIGSYVFGAVWEDVLTHKNNVSYPNSKPYSSEVT